MYDFMTVWQSYLFKADLILSSKDGNPIYYGMNDYGETINNLRRVYTKPKRKKKKSRSTATEQETAQTESISNKVLQFMFNGWTGFKFPVANFPITNMDSAQLREITTKVVNALHRHGFQVQWWFRIYRLFAWNKCHLGNFDCYWIWDQTGMWGGETNIYNCFWWMQMPDASPNARADNSTLYNQFNVCQFSCVYVW